MCDLTSAYAPRRLEVAVGLAPTHRSCSLADPCLPHDPTSFVDQPCRVIEKSDVANSEKDVRCKVRTQLGVTGWDCDWWEDEMK